jgi:nucleotide-binding universal stress UspA family protein
MSYKTILVHIDPGKNCEKRLEAAINLAREYDAYLVGLYAFSPYIPPGYIMAHMGAEIQAAQNKIAVESMSRTEEVFRKQTAAAGLDNIEWQTVYDDPVHAFSSHAQYADLVVIGQSDAAEDSGAAMDFPERLVLTAGRPVLILPNTGYFPSIGKRVLVAWNASQEATRAVSNAIPFLKAADNVYVMAVNSKTSKGDIIQSENMVRYLERLGVRAVVKDINGVEIDVGNELLSSASDLSADLIVMGCYGHSRLREWVLGGVTRTILDSMTIPVLMSH